MFKSSIHDAKRLLLSISGVLGLLPCLASDFRVLLAQSEQLLPYKNVSRGLRIINIV